MTQPIIPLLVAILVISGYIFLAQLACRNAPNSRLVPAIALVVLFLYLCAVGFVWLLYYFFGNNGAVIFAALCLFACAALGTILYICIRNRSTMHPLPVVFFLAACGVVAYVTLFSRLGTQSAGVRMEPFERLSLALETGDFTELGHDVLNFAMFLPLGILIPLMNPKVFSSAGYGLLFGLVASTVIETVQLLAQLGQCDINDVIANTLGAVVGTMLCLGYLQIRRNWRLL